MITLESVVKEANRKRKALGIKVSEKDYMPQIQTQRKVVMIEDSPFFIEVKDGGTVLTPFFSENGL